MLLLDLLEAIDDDISASALGEHLRTIIYSYLYNLKREHGDDYRLPMTATYGGVEMPCIPIRDLPQRYRFRDLQDVLLIFRIRNIDPWRMVGYASQLQQPRSEFSHIVVIDAFGETVLELLKTIGNDRMSNVFRHEIQHVLDGKRFKGDRFANSNGYKKPKENPRAYHNDPFEQNAYWHNLAEPILRNLRFMSENPEPEMWALINQDIDPDFSKFLEKALRRGGSIVRQHMQRLTGENRKRAIARLYQMHRKYFELLNSAKASAK